MKSIFEGVAVGWALVAMLVAALGNADLALVDAVLSVAFGVLAHGARSTGDRA